MTSIVSLLHQDSQDLPLPTEGRVLQENWETHERAKERFRSMLNSSSRRRAKLLQELDELFQGIEATVDRKLCKETEARISVLQTTLRKVEASIDESEDHLEESLMREEEARQEDQGQSDSSEEQDRDVIVEGAQESGPTSVEATGPPISTASIQGAEPAMEVDVGDILPLTSKDATTVRPKEDEMLMGDPTSVAGELAQLQVAPPESHEPQDGETS